jgi:hypothetical protein
MRPFLCEGYEFGSKICSGRKAVLRLQVFQIIPFACLPHFLGIHMVCGDLLLTFFCCFCFRISSQSAAPFSMINTCYFFTLCYVISRAGNVSRSRHTLCLPLLKSHRKPWSFPLGPKLWILYLYTFIIAVVTMLQNITVYIMVFWVTLPRSLVVRYQMFRANVLPPSSECTVWKWRDWTVVLVIKQHALKTCWVVEAWLHTSLTTVLDGGVWSW